MILLITGKMQVSTGKRSFHKQAAKAVPACAPILVVNKLHTSVSIATAVSSFKGPLPGQRHICINTRTIVIILNIYLR